MNSDTTNPTTGRALMLKPAQAAQQLQVDPSTIYRWVRDGTIPAVRIGSTIRIPLPLLVDRLRRSSLR